MSCRPDWFGPRNNGLHRTLIFLASMFFLAFCSFAMCYTALRAGTPDQRNLEGRSGRNPHSSIAQKSSTESLHVNIDTRCGAGSNGTVSQNHVRHKTLILRDPVKLEPIGEALRHNTIAILNGMSNSDPLANTVETAQAARPIPARLGPPHTFFRPLP